MARLSLSELRTHVDAGPPYEESLLELLASDGRAGAAMLREKCLRREGMLAKERARLVAMLEFENEAARNGFQRVAGVDEAGRGPLAGPIVAAAVVLAEPVEGLNDSKQLSARQREDLYGKLQCGSHSTAVAIIGADEIDRMGIQAANYAAMMQSAKKLEPLPDFLLVDGFNIRGCELPQKRLIKGDSRSLSIAAASIIAKVVRDGIMVELDKEYPGYGFCKHKGYGTRQHLEALERCGPCPEHRKSFAPIAKAFETGLLFEES